MLKMNMQKSVNCCAINTCFESVKHLSILKSMFFFVLAGRSHIFSGKSVHTVDKIRQVFKHKSP